MDVSVIIVNYNTLDLTKNCIESIFQNTNGVVFEVILVDNASSDGSKEFFERDKRITYIYSKTNLGFGRANNIGIQYAKGDYFFFLNSDTVLLNNAIYLLWERFNCLRKEDRIASAGTMLLDSKGEIIHSYAHFPQMSKTIIDNTIMTMLWKIKLIKKVPTTSNYNYSDFVRQPYFYVDYITGADLMVNREVVTKYGAFDPDFFMYCEETEMQYRFLDNGYKNVIVAGPQIIHLEGASNNKTSLSKKTMVYRSRFLYFKKTEKSVVKYKIFVVVFKIAYVSSFLVSFPFIKGSLRGKMKHLHSIMELS